MRLRPKSRAPAWGGPERSPGTVSEFRFVRAAIAGKKVLNLKVVNATTCRPISGTAVDIWHADALGIYSDVVPLGGGSRAQRTPGTFLRGIQNTDATGTAMLRSIYPGWYVARRFIST